MATLEEKIKLKKEGKPAEAMSPEANPQLEAKGIPELPMIDVEVPYNEKVPEPVVQEIKKKYTLNPEVLAETSSEPSIDFKGIRKQAAEMTPEISNTDLLLGLIPLGISALAGGYGEGAQVAAPYYMGLAKDQKERQKTLEDKLLEMQRAKLAKGSKGLTLEERIRLEQEKAKLKGSGEDNSALNRKQRQELADRQLLVQTRDKLVSDPEFKKSRTRYQATNDAINVLNQKNPIGDAGVQILFAKGIFGEVGNLTAQEQAKFIGSPELQRTFDRMMTKYKTGLLGEKDRDDLLKLAKHMRERAKQDASRVAKGYTSGLSSFGLNAEPIVNPLLETADIEPQFSDQAKTVQRKGKDGKIYTYTWNPQTGNYE